MADMNVKGGYFAPDNYLKVNEGGSHDENPNGGVQIGMDQNGVPNMLEEGEPVYNDFVYSDNIVADEEFLEKHDLPKKYKGWLYSKIADDLFEEYSENPLDPISKNGADIMLTRLAECQEEQKLAAEQAQLEEMLASLSPEERDALAQAMMEQQQPTPQDMAMMPQEVAPQEPVPMEGMPMEASPEQMALPGQPIMAACGGHISRNFDKGGKKDNWLKRTWNQAIKVPFMSGTATGYAVTPEIWKDDNTVDSTVGNELEYAGSMLASLYSPLFTPEGRAAFSASKKAYDALKSGVQVSNALGAARNTFEEAQAAKELAKSALAQRTESLATAMANGDVEDVRQATNLVRNAAQAVRGAAWEEAKKGVPYFLRSIPSGVKGTAAAGLMAIPVGRMVGAARNVSKNSPYFNNYPIDEKPVWGQPIPQPSPMVTTIDTTPEPKEYDKYNDWALGGKVNNYEWGSGPNFEPTTKYFLPDEYAGPVLPKIGTASQLPYRSFSGPTITGRSGVGVSSGSSGISPVAAGSSEINPADLMLKPTDVKLLAKMRSAAMQNYTSPGLVDSRLADRSNAARQAYYTNNPITDSDNNGQRMLSTAGMYLPQIAEAALAIGNAAQSPDKIIAERMQPRMISGNMRLIDPRYNPIDINQTVNTVTNQNNATARALMNSGNPVSTQAALIAADAVGNRNIGEAIAQNKLANEQLYNNAIAGYNNNESARAQFDLGIDRYNQAVDADAQRVNIQNNLYQQQANNQYDSQKWAAVSNQIQRGLDALYANGITNFNMNMVNSNPAFENYGISPSGYVNYMAAQNARPQAMPVTTYGAKIQPNVPSYYDNRYMPDYSKQFAENAEKIRKKSGLMKCGGKLKK